MSVELRWFVRGEVPGCAPPQGAATVRTDRYHVSTMTPTWSVKLRGGSKLEGKVRVGRVDVMHVGAVCGFAETWVKAAVPLPHPDRRTGWLDVRKELWRAGGSEIGRLTVGGQRWWTVCIDAGPSRRVRPLPPGWADVVAVHGEPHSYASWLLEVARNPRATDVPDRGRRARRA